MNAFETTEMDLFSPVYMVVNLFKCCCLITSTLDNSSYLKLYNK